MGNLQFYGKQNGQKSGWAREYYRARDSTEANDDPFAIHLEDAEDLKKLYHDAEHVGESSPSRSGRGRAREFSSPPWRAGDRVRKEELELTGRWVPPRYECLRG
jgi:hypothetical protein